MSDTAVRLGVSITLLFVVACAAVSSDPRDRTPGTIFDDEMLEALVKRTIRNSDPGFDGAHLVAKSHNGVVLLAGQVATEELKAAAQRQAASLEAVRSVHNELEVGTPISYMARANDGWLTTKVKSKLLANKETEGSKIKVITENGVVYLMGMVPRDEADRAVEVARSVFGVQKIVKVFEYLD